MLGSAQTKLPPLTLTSLVKGTSSFKMVFAMKGVGARGGLECHIPILKNDFFKKPFRIIP